MSTLNNAPLPLTDDLDTSGFWKAATEGKISIRTCAVCEAVLHLPKLYCHNCQSWKTYWRDVRPTGTLYSWTVTVQQLHPAFPTPYTVMLVELDDAKDARLIGYLEGTPELKIGMPMRANFIDAEPGVTLVQWKPSPNS